MTIGKVVGSNPISSTISFNRFPENKESSGTPPDSGVVSDLRWRPRRPCPGPSSAAGCLLTRFYKFPGNFLSQLASLKADHNRGVGSPPPQGNRPKDFLPLSFPHYQTISSLSPSRLLLKSSYWVRESWGTGEWSYRLIGDYCTLTGRAISSTVTCARNIAWGEPRPQRSTSHRALRYFTPGKSARSSTTWVRPE